MEPGQTLEHELALNVFERQVQQVTDVAVLQEMVIKLHSLNLGRQRVYEALLRGLE